MKKKAKVSNNLQPTNDSHIAQVVGLIKNVVCSYYNSDESAFDTKSRKTDHILVRHHAMYLCVKNLRNVSNMSNVSYALIGGFFDKDHATVMHVENKVDGLLTWDKDLQREIHNIQQMIIDTGRFVNGKMTFGQDYYYIDMSSITSVKLADNKAIIFVGIDEKSMLEVRNKFDKEAKLVNFNKTGMYILKKLEKKQND